MSGLDISEFVKVAYDRFVAEDAFQSMEKEINELLNEKNSWNIDTPAEDREKTDRKIAFYTSLQDVLLSKYPDLKNRD